jgi:hypothetical protein
MEDEFLRDAYLLSCCLQMICDIGLFFKNLTQSRKVAKKNPLNLSDLGGFALRVFPNPLSM